MDAAGPLHIGGQIADQSKPACAFRAGNKIDCVVVWASDKKLRGVISDEMNAIKEQFATPRVCPITLDAGEMRVEDLVDDTELVVVMTAAQYIKTVAASSFKRQARGGKGVTGAKLKSDDIVKHVVFTTAHAYLLFFSNRGRVYRIRAHELPERERSAKGVPIVNLLSRLKPSRWVMEKLAGIDDRRWPSFEKALTSLAAGDFIVPEESS